MLIILLLSFFQNSAGKEAYVSPIDQLPKYSPKQSKEYTAKEKPWIAYFDKFDCENLPEFNFEQVFGIFNDSYDRNRELIGSVLASFGVNPFMREYYYHIDDISFVVSLAYTIVRRLERKKNHCQEQKRLHRGREENYKDAWKILMKYWMVLRDGDDLQKILAQNYTFSRCDNRKFRIEEVQSIFDSVNRLTHPKSLHKFRISDIIENDGILFFKVCVWTEFKTCARSQRFEAEKINGEYMITKEVQHECDVPDMTIIIDYFKTVEKYLSKVVMPGYADDMSPKNDGSSLKIVAPSYNITVESGFVYTLSEASREVNRVFFICPTLYFNYLKIQGFTLEKGVLNFELGTSKDYKIDIAARKVNGKLLLVSEKKPYLNCGFKHYILKWPSSWRDDYLMLWDSQIHF